MKEGDSPWFRDQVTPDLAQLHRLRAVTWSGRTRYQEAQVIETAGFGRCLVLDGKIQSSEADEFIYHEALVHPAMVAHPQPQAVFIAGGGEGATLREVLAYPSVRRVVMADIDDEVVEVCRRFLPQHHQGSFQDPRLELRLEDARDYLARTQERFHVIILDLPEPMEAGPAWQLFTREFYELVRGRLEPGGLAVAQAGSATYTHLECFSAIAQTFKAVFPRVYPYMTEVPSFGGGWGFVLASIGPDPLSLTPQEVDARLARRLSRPLRFYDGLAHRGMFYLPKCHRQALAQGQLITDKAPLFIS